MNKFEKQLEKWNHGVLRGAQAKLAKALQVSTATTALWTTGKRRPSRGYVSQMADLFGMDEYSVLKLFENLSAVSYSLPQQAVPPTLHEEKATPTYVTSTPRADSAGKNTVQLPFLDLIPIHYPHYPETDVLEWWSIPRRYAQGAKYIVRSQDIALEAATSEYDLCFIKPAKAAAAGQLVLLHDKKGLFCTARVQMQKGKIAYIPLQRYTDKSPASWTLLGILVRRIQPL